MNLNFETRRLIESQNMQIIEGGWDFRYKTRIFILHPDGSLNPYYEHLYDIPMLPNGTNIDLDINAMPYDEYYGSTAVKDAGAVTNVEWALDAQGLPIFQTLLYIVLAVILLAIVICICNALTYQQKPPCGTEGSIVDVSDCAKIITMPNCDSRLYDSCNDQWLEPDWHRWEPPESWATWIAVAVIGIGAIILIPQILRAIKPQQPQYMPMPYYQPQPIEQGW